MKKNVAGSALAILCLFAACKKTTFSDDQKNSILPGTQQKMLQCGARQGAMHGPVNQRTTAATATATSPVLLLLDFNGQQVINSSWLNPGTISCPSPSSQLTAQMKDYIVNSVAEDFSPFFIKVTKNETEYNAAPINRRMRCVITCNMMGQFGNIGGVAIINSLSWADNTPCFVFCDVLEYNQKYIAGAVSHEIGHTFGLQHQSRYSADCTLEEEFHSGAGWDALGWAPIMGLSYYQPLVTWHNGQTILGCQDLQNDMSTIAGIAGFKADDYSASLNSGTALLPSSGKKTGILENAADKDAFLKNETTSKRIRVVSNGNSDLALEVYSASGQLQNVYDDNAGTDVNVVITGKKYVKVRVSSGQPFAPAGDGCGGYTINISAP